MITRRGLLQLDAGTLVLRVGGECPGIYRPDPGLWAKPGGMGVYPGGVFNRTG